MIEDKKTIKFINNISDYEIYWFALQINYERGLGLDIFQQPQHLRTDIFDLIQRNKISTNSVDDIARRMKIEIFIPLNSVRWFYQKNRETLVIFMLSHMLGEPIMDDHLKSQYDLEHLNINITYSYKILKFKFGTDNISPGIGKMSFIKISEELELLFKTIKTPASAVKWLDKKNKNQIEWAYKYKSRPQRSGKNLQTESILAFTQLFDIDSDDTDLMYDHIITSLDFSVLNEVWNSKDGLLNSSLLNIARDKRLNTINKMKNAWHKKVSQEKKKNTGKRFKLSTEALTQLKELAKQDKKSQDKLLEKIIADYYKKNRFRGVL